MYTHKLKLFSSAMYRIKISEIMILGTFVRRYPIPCVSNGEKSKDDN